MAKSWSLVILLATTAAVSACASVTKERNDAQAPQPMRSVELRRLYDGVWYEYARTPTRENRDCLAPRVVFFRDDDGLLLRRDVCRPRNNREKERIAVGAVQILNPGPDTKMLVRFKVMGAFYVPKVFWVLDHGVTYNWFIASDPEFKTLSVYTRDAVPPAPVRERVMARVQALGWPLERLEYPASTLRAVD